MEYNPFGTQADKLNRKKLQLEEQAKAAVQAVKKAAKPKEYISERSSNLGNTYKKYGLVSVLSKASTPETRKQALASKRAKRKLK